MRILIICSIFFALTSAQAQPGQPGFITLDRASEIWSGIRGAWEATPQRPADVISGLQQFRDALVAANRHVVLDFFRGETLSVIALNNMANDRVHSFTNAADLRQVRTLVGSIFARTVQVNRGALTNPQGNVARAVELLGQVFPSQNNPGEVARLTTALGDLSQVASDLTGEQRATIRGWARTEENPQLRTRLQELGRDPADGSTPRRSGTTGNQTAPRSQNVEEPR